MQTEAPTVRYLLPCLQFVCSRSWRETFKELWPRAVQSALALRLSPDGLGTVALY